MIKFGIDTLLEKSPSWKKNRIGLVTNHAATTQDLTPSRVALIRQQFNIQKLFSPEHGLDMMGADGEEMKDGIDSITGLPIISLYSSKLAPSKEDLADVDIILFDIPDIGSRFYTYLWTLTYVMEACAKFEKKCIVLDRPNPISGNLELVEGPILIDTQASFLGRWPIPIRHSATLGELALYFNDTQKIGCLLEIVTSKNWDRNFFQTDWGIPFVPTSPAIQSFESMLLYPGLCLLESTNISEARGTDHSFCQVGAPWINGNEIASLLNEMGLDEIEAIPTQFTPKENKYKNELCNGVQFFLREHAFFQPVSYGLILIRLIKQIYPHSFEWKPYPTLVNPSGQLHLDKLLGISNSETIFELSLPKSIAEITKITQCKEWKEEINPFLLY